MRLIVLGHITLFFSLSGKIVEGSVEHTARHAYVVTNSIERASERCGLTRGSPNFPHTVPPLMDAKQVKKAGFKMRANVLAEWNKDVEFWTNKLCQGETVDFKMSDADLQSFITSSPNSLPQQPLPTYPAQASDEVVGKTHQPFTGATEIFDTQNVEGSTNDPHTVYGTQGPPRDDGTSQTIDISGIALFAVGGFVGYVIFQKGVSVQHR